MQRVGADGAPPWRCAWFYSFSSATYSHWSTARALIRIVNIAIVISIHGCNTVAMEVFGLEELREEELQKMSFERLKQVAAELRVQLQIPRRSQYC